MEVIIVKEIIGKRFGEERALYNLNNSKVIDCRFEGEEDGESALKEASNIEILNTYMDLRYPLWHVESCKMDKVIMKFSFFILYKSLYLYLLIIVQKYAF